MKKARKHEHYDDTYKGGHLHYGKDWSKSHDYKMKHKNAVLDKDLKIKGINESHVYFTLTKRT